MLNEDIKKLALKMESSASITQLPPPYSGESMIPRETQEEMDHIRLPKNTNPT